MRFGYTNLKNCVFRLPLRSPFTIFAHNYLTTNDVTMKTKSISACIIMAATLAACNDEAFTDNFMTDVPQVLLTADDSCAAVGFDAANWGVLRCYSLHGGMETAATSPSGEPQELPWGIGEMGLLSYGDRFLDFGLEKPGSRSLRLTLRENLYDEPVRMYIEVGNNYETRTLEPLLMPTPKYAVDSVVYDWDKFNVTSNGEQLDLVNIVEIDNTGGTRPLTVAVYPYKYSKREIMFYSSDGNWVEQNYLRIFGSPLPEMEIPDIVDGKAAMLGAKAVFGVQHQEAAGGQDKGFYVEITAEAGTKRELEVYNYVYSYYVPYTVYASCQWSDRRRVFSGMMTCSNHKGYFLFERKQTEGGDE